MTAFEWTGNGLAVGTTLSTGNINTAGNGSTLDSTSGTTMVHATDGFEFSGAAGVITRLNGSFPATKTFRDRAYLTPRQNPGTAEEIFLNARSTSASAASVSHQTNGKVRVLNALLGTLLDSPVALTIGHRYVLDRIVCLNQGATPSATNGRIVLWVRDLDDATWNTTGEWFYDSGYAVNVGTVDISVVRFGKVGGGSLLSVSTPHLMQRPGWENSGADLSGVTTPAAVKALFPALAYSAPGPSYPAVVPGSLAHFGDSTSFQDALGEGRIRNKYLQLGYAALLTFFYACIGKPIILPDDNGYSVLDNIDQARAYLGGEAATNVVQLGSNGHNPAGGDTTVQGWINQVFAKINPASRIIWIGLSQVDGYDSGTGATEATRRHFNDVAKAVVQSYPNGVWADWDERMDRLGDAGMWDSSGVHMTVIPGYEAKNQFYQEKVSPRFAQSKAFFAA